jgi:UDP-N-acetylglucosamine 2-epimerase (non-hydrolysing)
VKILSVVGARPNFMKIGPIAKEISRWPDLRHVLVHTGQHYDFNMSETFFRDLEIPNPDIFLGVGSGSHAEQTGKVMAELEKVIQAERPDVVVVVGDVNSTMAAAITAAKLCVPVAHVEAGLRSFDRSMPEEINRVVTDAVSELLFVSETSGLENLAREGVAKEKLFFVGNVMIDSLLENIEQARKGRTWERFGVFPRQYALLTLHRPSNVDSQGALEGILSGISEISRFLPVVFPVHPRTRKKIMEYGKKDVFANGGDTKTGGGRERGILLSEPLSYLEFLSLESEAKIVLTDSGGIQEETTVLGIPCLTIRKNTERPVTVTAGTNVLVGGDGQRIVREADRVMRGEFKRGSVPELWDGRTAERIVSILRRKTG